MKNLFVFTLLLAFAFTAKAQQKTLDSIFPVRGISLEAPSTQAVDSFVTFLGKEIAPRHINTLILRVDYRFRYKTHPELVGSDPLSYDDVKKIAAVCKANGIKIVPQINLLGHQSWENNLGKLLEQYPEFDETPRIKMPAKYEWPNPDRLYCKSYCPLHPDVHKVVFDVVDELLDAFDTDAFHAGMDEVFYIADPDCPRCQGHDPAELFAGEVTKINNHLKEKGRELWIWGDRLLEGKTTGLGMWEASYNNTWRAIDMIPKDVFICDWHYERPDKTAVIFANKGLRVATSPWRKPEVTAQQIKDMAQFRADATPQVKNNYAGIVQTIWTPTTPLMAEAYKMKTDKNFEGSGQWASFLNMVKGMEQVVDNANALVLPLQRATQYLSDNR